MANSNRPSGLSPVSYLNGSPWNQQARMYYIESTDPNAFAIGDPVVLSGAGSASGVPAVTLATAGTGNNITGVLVGMGGTVEGGTYGDPSNLDTTIIPATKTKGYWVAIADDPNILFEIQEGGTALTVASCGINCNLTAGANNGYVSGWVLNNSSVNTGADRQVQLLGLVQRADNAVGTYAKWLVRINTHSYKAGIAGV